MTKIKKGFWTLLMGCAVAVICFVFLMPDSYSSDIPNIKFGNESEIEIDGSEPLVQIGSRHYFAVRRKSDGDTIFGTNQITEKWSVDYEYQSEPRIMGRGTWVIAEGETVEVKFNPGEDTYVVKRLQILPQVSMFFVILIFAGFIWWNVYRRIDATEPVVERDYEIR